MLNNRELACGEGYFVGEFLLPPDSPRWQEMNWIGRRATIVLPSTLVGIVPERAELQVSTPNHLLVYDPEVHYRRRLISGAGDSCVFVSLGERLGFGPRRGLAPGVRALPLPAPTFAHQLLEREVLTEEWVLDLVAYVGLSLGSRPRPLGPRQRAAVERLKQTLAEAGNRNLTLAEYAAAVHYSPFALARMFRAHTGYSIGEFRQQLRLRASLREVLAPARDLGAVAARFGFSSHSHFTSAFRRAFGITPSQARGS
jgi:AraC-like DNA-binding protein